MRCYACIILTWALALCPMLAGAAPLDNSISNGISIPLTIVPARDDANEDSVIYEYGFEDGWGGWTTDDLTEVPAMWHVSESNAWDGGSSWWCADEEVGGYQDHWLQHLMTPVIDLSAYESARLEFMLYWSVERPGGEPEGYDAWDGCNVWISTDGGDNWDVIEPEAPRYTHRSLYSFGFEWGMGEGIPGWCASSGQWPLGSWVQAGFDLDDYAGEESVRLRFSFSSDPAWATGGVNDPDGDCIGMVVDEIQVFGDDEVIWENTGDEIGDMFPTHEQGEPSGDFWEITDSDAATGDFSAHCPVRANLIDALITPPIEIPSNQYYTYFDFMVRADTRLSDSNNDGNLDDYFVLYVQELENANWTRMIYDYSDGVGGARPDWDNDFLLYGPGTFSWNHLEPEWINDPWKWQFNLTEKFAGKTIRLRWQLNTDSVMTGNQGEGLFIDDLRVSVSTRLPNDVGVEWMHVPHHAMIGSPVRSMVKVKNFGMSDQPDIIKLWRIDSTPERSFNQGEGLSSDSSKVYDDIFIFINPPYADTVTISARTAMPNDQNFLNNRKYVNNVVIYPAGIMVLGYDQREFTNAYPIPPGSGPAVLFTPRSDGYTRNYDLNALRVRWRQQVDNRNAETVLHLYEDNNRQPGDQIYEERITVRDFETYPEVQVIDLTEVEEVKDRTGNFWVWFEIVENDSLPMIIGATPDVVPDTTRHFFVYDGERTTFRAGQDYQIHAVLMGAGVTGKELVPGRSEINFPTIQPNTSYTTRVALFNGGTETVRIDRVSVDNEAFTLDPGFDNGYTLRIGDMAHVYVTFTPPDDDLYVGRITIETDDETPPFVRLLGQGDIEAGVDDEAELPREFAVGAAYPNPFNAATTIPYSLPRTSQVKLTIYDLAGRAVAEPLNGVRAAGHHSLTIGAGDLNSGVYFYRFEAGDFSKVGKIALVK